MERIIWDGSLVRIVAKKIEASSYVLKFEATAGLKQYQHFKWGIPKGTSINPPRWLPFSDETFNDPEMGIYAASLDLSEARYYTVIVKSMPCAEHPE